MRILVWTRMWRARKQKMLKAGLKYFVMAGLLILLSFCFYCKKSVSPTYTDVDAIKDYIRYHPDIFMADVFDTVKAAPFFREITARDNWIKINFHEPDSVNLLKSADVSWEDTLFGVFHTFISGTEYTRSFRGFSRVNAYFEQWGNSGDLYRGWLLMKVSNLPVNCPPYPTVGFSSLRMDTSGVGTSINTDALSDVKKILAFRRMNQVKFTVQVSDSTDVYYLHTYDETGWTKRRFNNEGGNSFSVTWTPSSQDYTTYRHAYIDCIESKSIADSSFSRLDSRTWGIIYRMKQ